MTKKKKILISILVVVIFLIVGVWGFFIHQLASETACNFYGLFFTGRCFCPEGQKEFKDPIPYFGFYCASDSQKPCYSPNECPENENCISKNGENWFCSGNRWACWIWDEKGPRRILCNP